jgi:hypothetical protein
MPEDTAVPEDEVFVPPSVVDPTSTDSSVEPSSASNESPTGTDDEEVVLPEFDPKYRLQFEGLLFIGKVSRTFRWLGHTFVIRTPRIDEILEIGQLHEPYNTTVADVKAYQTLLLAAIIETVDGQPLPIPITDEVSLIASRFDYIKRHWYPWTLDKLYEEYLLLDAGVKAVHDSLGKA